jgi:hypothetical protein
MNANFEKNAGISLVVFTLLMAFTMILHPAGGSFEHLLKIRSMIIITHAIAIVSLPFGFIGFWGLTKRIGTDNFLSATAFSFILFGLMAVMVAAAANGLVMPMFIEKYKDASPEIIASIKPVLKYSLSVNAAFDYIYTGAFCLAILAWSVAILYSKKLPAWVAWLGIALSLAGTAIFISGFSIISLHGFRMFVSGIVLWIAIAGISLIRTTKDPG